MLISIIIITCISKILQLRRAARFCNGAAHGGQVVGPSAIVPGLLQAWGCVKLPDGQSLGLEPQVESQATARMSFIPLLALSIDIKRYHNSQASSVMASATNTA